jgi:hypothetical protein
MGDRHGMLPRDAVRSAGIPRLRCLRRVMNKLRTRSERDAVSQAREKFSTRVDSQTLEAVRALAAREGRQLQTLVEEALTDLLEKHRIDSPRAQVMSTYVASHEKYGELYKKLAE